MLKTKQEGIFLKKTRSAAYKIFSILENNNDADFNSNGEDHFLKSCLEQFKNGNITVFDVGANHGKYSEIVQKYCSKFNIAYDLHLFEPVKASYLLIEKKFQGVQGILLNNFGVSDANNTSDIYFDKEGSSLASLYKRDLSQVNIHLNRTESIALRRLDEYMNEKKIKTVDFLKLDVEGHEFSAFKGMGQYLRPEVIRMIQFEYGAAYIDARTYLKDVYEYLTSRGYKICKITKSGLELRDYSERMENFAYANYAALSPELL